ncbi:MAG: nucleotide exchange factor GrpE [Nitrospirae bacterium]|nr:nucleotide exchange factor GrpE [Nitrospirota bacterium]MDA1303590.1 nucleotide exchange factor GrpE [Nitrospirota bacterium]
MEPSEEQPKDHEETSIEPEADAPETVPVIEIPTIVQSELDAKETELQTLNDKYLRLAAEFENYKRRAQRDQSDTVRFANEKLLKDLIPTVDNLERALQCSKEQSDAVGLLQGVELTYKQYLDTLEKCGVTQVSSVGEPFDPAKHQAVGQVESSTIAENCVVDEYQKGYFLQDRILRPAMVTVAKAAANGDAEASQEDDGSEQNKEGE